MPQIPKFTISHVAGAGFLLISLGFFFLGYSEIINPVIAGVGSALYFTAFLGVWKAFLDAREEYPVKPKPVPVASQTCQPLPAQADTDQVIACFNCGEQTLLWRSSKGGMTYLDCKNKCASKEQTPKP
jgi:hypothetical protein